MSVVLHDDVLITSDGTRLDYETRLFDAVRVVAHKIAATHIKRTHEIREASLSAASPETVRALRGLPKQYGSVRQSLPINSADVLAALVSPALQPDVVQGATTKLDTDVCVALLTIAAQNAIDFFKAELLAVFPTARLVGMDELEDLKTADEEHVLLIAPVKGGARVHVKVNEYAKKHGNDVSQWPFSELLGDLLRATVACGNFDAFAEAWKRVEATFRVRNGHGRLKVRRPLDATAASCPLTLLNNGTLSLCVEQPIYHRAAPTRPFGERRG